MPNRITAIQRLMRRPGLSQRRTLGNDIKKSRKSRNERWRSFFHAKAQRITQRAQRNPSGNSWRSLRRSSRLCVKKGVSCDLVPAEALVGFAQQVAQFLGVLRVAQKLDILFVAHQPRDISQRFEMRAG